MLRLIVLALISSSALACQGVIEGLSEDEQPGDFVSDDLPPPPLFVDQHAPGDFEYTLLFQDDFTQGESIDVNKWRHEPMDGVNGREHRVPHIDVNSDKEMGRRHAAWYNDYRDQTSYVDPEEGVLIQRGLVDRSRSEDDRRDSYLDKDGEGTGVNGEIQFGDFRLYASWIDTFSYVQQPSGQRSPDPNRPQDHGQSIVFEPGTYFEINVNFEFMNTTGHRHSFWLMPVALNPDEVKAYDGNAALGAEIDIYEHEFSERPDEESRSESKINRNNNTLYMKTIASDTLTTINETDKWSDAFAPGDQKRTAVYAPGISAVGTKSVSFGTKMFLIWYVDGREAVRDSTLVPKVPMYMIVSRE